MPVPIAISAGIARMRGALSAVVRSGDKLNLAMLRGEFGGRA